MSFRNLCPLSGRIFAFQYVFRTYVGELDRDKDLRRFDLFNELNKINVKRQMESHFTNESSLVAINSVQLAETICQ